MDSGQRTVGKGKADVPQATTDEYQAPVYSKNIDPEVTKGKKLLWRHVEGVQWNRSGLEGWGKGKVRERAV